MRLALGTTVAIAAIALLAPPAAAQDALGGGDVLDSNLNVEGPRNIESPRIDFQARNLLVTNNVAGGRGFRESVGYTADTDFRQELGGDVTYGFRADSALSSLAVLNYGGNRNFELGQDVASIVYRRDATGASLGSFEPLTTSEAYETRLQLDRLARTSSLLETSGTEIEPIPIGQGTNRDGIDVVVHASTLTGISVRPRAADYRSYGLTTYDFLRVVEDENRGIGTPPPGAYFGATFQDLRLQNQSEGTMVEPQSSSTWIDPSRDREYVRVLERIAQRYADAQGVQLDIEGELIESLDQEFRRLREELRGLTEPALPAEEGTEDPLDDLQPPGAGRIDPDTGLDPSVEPDEGGEEVEDPMVRIGEILRHGERIETLVLTDQGRFHELLTGAQEALQEGQYFQAERRFTRALRFQPGHPLATAGLGHTQLGAGTYLSAALTLRSLLTHQPEMIDVQYADTLFPNRVRTMRAVDSIRERLLGRHDVALYAFLLAYIGHQIDDAALVQQGLEALERADADDELLPLLREVWGSE